MKCCLFGLHVLQQNSYRLLLFLSHRLLMTLTWNTTKSNHPTHFKTDIPAPFDICPKAVHHLETGGQNFSYFLWHHVILESFGWNLAKWTMAKKETTVLLIKKTINNKIQFLTYSRGLKDAVLKHVFCCPQQSIQSNQSINQSIYIAQRHNVSNAQLLWTTKNLPINS